MRITRLAGPRTKEAADLARKGASVQTIAALMGIRTQSASALLTRARSANLDLPDRALSGSACSDPEVAIHGRTLNALKSAALERGLSPRVLAHRLLHQIARDDLIDAILDDREDLV